MNKRILILLGLLLTQSVFAKNYLDENLKKLKWNDIEVVWLEDDSLPTFDVIFYFGTGALADGKGKEGLTELTLSELTSGTNQFSQSKLLESLEYFGVVYGSRVTHEFSSFAVSGLEKNFSPSLKLICHAFKDAKFPKAELKRTKNRIYSGLKSMVTNQGALANRVFRYESMKGTGYESPTEGTLKSLKRIKSRDLKKRLDYFNNKSFKRIYLRGSKEVLGLENIVKNDCEWTQGKSEENKVVSKLPKPKVIFVPIPKSNLVQVRIGRSMMSSEIAERQHELKTFSGRFMGGGFTSRLMQGLRVQAGTGLTYSASAYVSEQRNYGRIGISSFTEDERLPTLLTAVKNILESNTQSIEKDVFERAVRNATGNYLLGLESTSDFLKNLLYFDHVGRDYAEIYQYSDKVKGFSPEQLKKMIAKNFNWNDQVIVLLGNEGVKKILSREKIQFVEKNYQDYL